MVVVVIFSVLLVGTLLGIGYLITSLKSERYSSLTEDREKSLFIAKAGIHRAEQYIINRRGNFASAKVNAPSWVPADYQFSGYLLANEGVSDDQRLSAEVFIIESNPSTYHILSQGKFQKTQRILLETVNLSGGSVVDQYFSTAVVADADGGILTSENTIIIAPEGDSLLFSGLPPIIEPNTYDEDHSGEILSSEIVLSDINPHRPKTYFYDGIDLSSNQEVVVDGDVQLYVNGDVAISGGAQIGRCIDAVNISGLGNCSLVIYVLGSGNVTIGGTSEVRAAIYAPQSTLVASSGTPEIYGALVGFAVDLRGSVMVVYDSDLTAKLADLEETGVETIQVDPEVQFTGWEEI
ncbi:MAG: hypothetical protein ACE5JP_10800 [Candidatus Bipolaricaulia bacterium]